MLLLHVAPQTPIAQRNPPNPEGCHGASTLHSRELVLSQRLKAFWRRSHDSCGSRPLSFRTCHGPCAHLHGKTNDKSDLYSTKFHETMVIVRFHLCSRQSDWEIHYRLNMSTSVIPMNHTIHPPCLFMDSILSSRPWLSQGPNSTRKKLLKKQRHSSAWLL